MLSYEEIRNNVRKTGWVCSMPTNTCVGYCGRAFVKGCPLSGCKMDVSEVEELISEMEAYRKDHRES